MIDHHSVWQIQSPDQEPFSDGQRTWIQLDLKLVTCHDACRCDDGWHCRDADGDSDDTLMNGRIAAQVKGGDSVRLL